MAEGHMCGQYTMGGGGYSPRKFLKFESQNVISCILSIQSCSKINANYTCIWKK
jgi:hypothetical protein